MNAAVIAFRANVNARSCHGRAVFSGAGARSTTRQGSGNAAAPRMTGQVLHPNGGEIING